MSNLFDHSLGLCLVCVDNHCCPVECMLPTHRTNVAVYGEYYGDERPDLWEEESVEEPTVIDGEVVWCPLCYLKKTED